MKKILLTGATGQIGTIVHEDLAGHYEFTCLSRRKMDAPGWVQIDLADEYDRLAGLTAEHDAVIHLAYVEEDGVTTTNVQMIRNILRATADAPNRPRVIVASSMHAVGGYVNWDEEPYSSIARRDYAALKDGWPVVTTNHAPYPNGLYGALKCYIEALAKFYAEFKGLEVVVARYGGVRADDAYPDEAGYHAFRLSRRDCAHFHERALEASLAENYNLVFVMSANTYNVYDIESARHLLGYAPQDNAEERA